MFNKIKNLLSPFMLPGIPPLREDYGTEFQYLQAMAQWHFAESKTYAARAKFYFGAAITVALGLAVFWMFMCFLK